jgi:hypothetical protein
MSEMTNDQIPMTNGNEAVRFAQTYEELMGEGPAAERMGWIFAAGLGVAVILVGVFTRSGKVSIPNRHEATGIRSQS